MPGVIAPKGKETLTMEWSTANVFFILILLLCVGMHLFGHGHGGHGERRDDQNDNRSGSDMNGQKNHHYGFLYLQLAGQEAC